MAELFFSAFLDVLFDRLATPDVLRFFRQLVGGVDSKIIAWKSEFQMIQGVLTDAEQRQLTDLDVKQWLDYLKHLVYDAEDILDDFANQALEQNLLAQHNQGIFNQFVGLVPAMISNYSMALQIEEITGRLAQLSEREGKLKLQRIPEGTSSTLQRPRTSSVPTESSVLGRSNDKDKILRMVITDSPSDEANIAVITIVGAGGVGKTTLAREVYNDKAVEDYVKAWVCVSDVFDVLGNSKQLLQSITSDPRDLKTLDAVQVQLKKEVDGKKILMVLDDVWNEDHLLWDDLKAPFKCAASNIKIIVTTRNSQVAVAMEPTQKYNLQRLTDEDCWSLFMMQALDRSPAVFREKVVGKCGGLPLAAKIRGGLLRFKNHNEWDTILDSNILHLLQQEQLKNSIVPVLGLSYHHLPSHLKRCFAYCAIFPKNYEYEKSELVLLWIAEGLMQQSGNEEPEEWGRKCFEVLLSRSIFEKSRGDCSKFVMHDLVDDVAQFVAGETIFKLDLEEANKSSRRFERVRHLFDNRDVFDVENAFQDLKFERLRTFLPISRTFRRSCIPSMFLSQLLQKFKLLRVLSLEGYCIIELPDSIGGLKLLKYLNLAGTVVISLPESICSLLNLQILILRNCRLLSKLPANIGNLINLHHLNIKGAQKLKEMPLEIKDLKNLRKLSNFIVGKGGTVSDLKDLKNLKFIGGEICISGLENVENSNEDAALWDKENL